MTSLRFEQWVPFPLEKVFLFFADPHNLPRIMPPATGTRIIQLKLVPPVEDARPLGGPRTEIITSFRPIPLLPFRQKWIALITEFEWNHHFADIQKQGPFKNWHHRHEFSAATRDGVVGTIVRDVIDYEIGFGVLGKIADELFVRRTFNKMFAYRQKTLEKLLE
jgi:ligand-binding SRPBCC domain-containing protein